MSAEKSTRSLGLISFCEARENAIEFLRSCDLFAFMNYVGAHGKLSVIPAHRIISRNVSDARTFSVNE